MVAAESALPNARAAPGARPQRVRGHASSSWPRAVRLGALVDGSRLPPERELAQRLGVSRATLREAIAALRAAGLVATTAGRGGGTVVTYAGRAGATRSKARALRQKAPELHDALDFRRVVEPGAAYLAAQRQLDKRSGERLDPEQRDWLQACLTEVTDAPDAVAHRVADSRLHLAIATLSGSPRLIEAVTQVQAQLHEMLSAIPVLPTRTSSTPTRQHARIVRAVLAGRPASARAGDGGALRRHVGAAARPARDEPLDDQGHQRREDDEMTEAPRRTAPLTVERLRELIDERRDRHGRRRVHRHAGTPAGQADPRAVLPRRRRSATAPRAATTCSPSTST